MCWAKTLGPREDILVKLMPTFKLQVAVDCSLFTWITTDYLFNYVFRIINSHTHTISLALPRKRMTVRVVLDSKGPLGLLVDLCRW